MVEVTEKDRARARMALYGEPKKGAITMDLGRVETLAYAVATSRVEERDRCLAIVAAQPFYPDTHTGMRQQWVKDQITAEIRKAAEAADEQALLPHDASKES